MRLRENIELKEFIEEDVIVCMQEKRSLLRERAKITIEKIQCKNRKNYNSKRKKANAYEVSDLVAIKRTQVAPESKFRAKF